MLLQRENETGHGPAPRKLAGILSRSYLDAVKLADPAPLRSRFGAERFGAVRYALAWLCFGFKQFWPAGVILL